MRILQEENTTIRNSIYDVIDYLGQENGYCRDLLIDMASLFRYTEQYKFDNLYWCKDGDMTYLSAGSWQSTHRIYFDEIWKVEKL